MKYQRHPVKVDAVSFTDLEAGMREDWVSEAIADGEIYQQGGEEPYWTVVTPSGTLQLRGDDMLVRVPGGALHVYSKEEFEREFTPCAATSEPSGSKS